MAQYYHVYDWEQFPIQYIAILACGLPDDSRVMRALGGKHLDTFTYFLGTVVDQLNIMIYQNSGGKTEKPQSIIDKLLGQKNEQNTSAVTFSSAEAFLLYRNKYVKDKEENG